MAEAIGTQVSIAGRPDGGIVPTSKPIPKKRSGAGTGGGATSKDIQHFAKDGARAGAMPDDQKSLDKLTKNKFDDNEKCVEGDVTPTLGHPEVNAGDTIELKGIGDRFSGTWLIEEHVLSVSIGSGVTSTMSLSRNALGDSKKGQKTAESVAEQTIADVRSKKTEQTSKDQLGTGAFFTTTGVA